MDSRAQKTGTRERLLEAGCEAFLKHGFHGTGLKAVLGSVGIPKGSFYNYFNSKDAFGAATVAFYAEGVGRRMTRAFGAAPDPAQGLKSFFLEEMADYAKSDFVGGCLVANLGGEVETSQPVREALATAQGQYIQGITEAVRSGQREGLFRDDQPAEELAQVLVDTWEGAVIRMKIERSVTPLENSLRHILDNYFRPR